MKAAAVSLVAVVILPAKSSLQMGCYPLPFDCSERFFHCLWSGFRSLWRKQLKRELLGT